MSVICINEDGTEHDFTNGFTHYVNDCERFRVSIGEHRLNDSLSNEIRKIHVNGTLDSDAKEFLVNQLIIEYKRIVR